MTVQHRPAGAEAPAVCEDHRGGGQEGRTGAAQEEEGEKGRKVREGDFIREDGRAGLPWLCLVAPVAAVGPPGNIIRPPVRVSASCSQKNSQERIPLAATPEAQYIVTVPALRKVLLV